MSDTASSAQQGRRITAKEYLAPVRGLVVALALTVPFWVMVGVAIGYAVR